MKSSFPKKAISALIITILLIAGISGYIIIKQDELFKEETKEEEKIILKDGEELITINYEFTKPIIDNKTEFAYIYSNQADFYNINDGEPVLPVNLTSFELPFGTKIIDFNYTYSQPKTEKLTKKISYGSCSAVTEENIMIYNSKQHPDTGFITYHTGGGLSGLEHKTFLNVRVYPVVYHPADDEIEYIEQVKIDIIIKQPEEKTIDGKTKYDLLIITPEEYKKSLNPLVNHKNQNNMITSVVTTEEIYDKDIDGRDNAEKIKYYIKQSIENWGIKYVLLVGGVKGQTKDWNIPARHSNVLIPKGVQETPEHSFLSDLYFADIYDSEGDFSSWDSNNNDVFAEWIGNEKDEMDLYPDVYLGRLPCRNTKEVRTMVNKIIKYENLEKDECDWFKRIILIANDHWPDEGNINEGALIMKEAKKILPDFESVDLYTSTVENKLVIRDINKAINQGAGFLYFCGHGSHSAWGIHYPPDATGWGPSVAGLNMILLSFYKPIYMKLLRNKEKLPITLVGGCNNGQFDVTLFNGKATSCWAWKLTVQKNGGSIATIANTGLGTHAMDDKDNNGINEYLEVLDGWLELHFLRLYKEENIDILGQLHSTSMKDYLNIFLGSNFEMDTKMVQQWELFGDPSLKINC